MDRTPSGPSQDTSPTNTTSSNKRKGGRRKSGQDTAAPAPAPAPASASIPSQSTKKTKKTTKQQAPEPAVDTTPTGQNAVTAPDKAPNHPIQAPDESDASDDESPSRAYDGGDLFGGSFFSRHGGPGNLTSALRAMSGFMPGLSGRLKDLMTQLKTKEDPSVQLIALQDLSQILLVSTEDSLQGQFSSDQCVKELVTLMQPSETGEENPEMMLLACRCLANLMEALPSATANVVYGGAVPVLCQKLLEIHYIDLAEQALSTLEKISVEFPGSIVREGGLTACLTYLDFFATSTQRTAVTTAANCCRKISEDSFPVIRDVMPILLGVLSSSDQKVVEKGSLCVSGIVDSFGRQSAKLEELVSPDLLKAVLRLLLPGTTNLIGPNIHTQFLRVLAITARASPRLSAELLKMDVVDTLYQILTGVSPPSGTDDAALKIDKNVIMQALVHRPREQIFETLNVICELLPCNEGVGMLLFDDLQDSGFPGDGGVSLPIRSRDSQKDGRLESLKDCKDELRRFAIILLPTLTEAYSSTVNLSVRQKVLTAQLKMLSSLDTQILEDALRVVPFASYLASILSQEDHATLVTCALQAAELLLKRLENIYRYQFYREGVISEISRLASRSISITLKDAPWSDRAKANIARMQRMHPGATTSSGGSFSSMEQPVTIDDELDDEHDEDNSEGDEDGHDQDEVHDDDEDDSGSSSSSHSSRRVDDMPPQLPNLQDVVTMRAKRFLHSHESDSDTEFRKRATDVLNDLKNLAQDIRACYSGAYASNGRALFMRLANYFDGDALESITSYELLSSGIVEALVDIFISPKSLANASARSTFLEVFMGSRMSPNIPTTADGTTVTPYSVLVQKLQDLLSRAEHFEVFTVHQNAFDSNRSSATSMLAKQLRLKLIADDESGIHKSYRSIMVSIHAIATFKALDDYLRPRINPSENPKVPKSREKMTNAIAAYAAAMAADRSERRPPGGTSSLPGPIPGFPLSSTSNRPSTKKSSRPAKPSTPPGHGQSSPDVSQVKSSNVRRSTRKQSGHIQTPPPPPPPAPPEPEDPTGISMGDTLECADENPIEDDEDDDPEAALDALVDDLEDTMDEDLPDPSAVSVEVADTGKITARQADGTRVPTPMQGTPVQGLRGLPTSSRHTPKAALAEAGQATPTSSARPMSYAAAIQAVPQDWHIEFSVNDKPISNDTTIYRAVHFNRPDTDELSTRTVWSSIHTIKFKRVPGPPPADPKSITPPPESPISASGLPQSLDKNPTTSAILRMLSILHEFNSNLGDVLDNRGNPLNFSPEPLAQFVNTKLTAKLNRQLEEPLIVASSCLPAWSEDLARLYPFLFPFETRHLFLQSTSFGYSRSMTRWQNAQSTSDSRHDRHRDERPFLGRLQRQKVRISRSKILESAIKVMELYGSSASVLEVEYFEEVGTGLGPTLEFYSTVSKEFSKKKLKLWREDDSNSSDGFAFGKRGLFPAPMGSSQIDSDNGKRILHLFKMLGKFVARSMLDSRIIDVSFNPTFFRVGEGSHAVSPSLGAVASVDPQLANSLKLLKQFATAKQQIEEDSSLTPSRKARKMSRIEVGGSHVEDLGLDFTLPGYPSIDLIEGGSDKPVTIENVDAYVESVIDFTLGSGVQKQVEAFRSGFSQVFPYTALRAFTPDELVMLFGRSEEDWSLETLLDSVKADHGYNLDSRSVRNLLQTMSEFTAAQRRDFLQFVTGSPKLPIGGFKSLTPMFTVVCKPSEPPYTPDDYLPSVMTCVNYLKMPDYTTSKMLRERLAVAIKEGQGAFHLS
ncbi:MAG: Ubiquitin fusion degradation protein 4 [Bogoriella megaspora]|nr:MAG: Ubiquitin fusion degradation protein 4 [Bogoriella megaspora]